MRREGNIFSLFVFPPGDVPHGPVQVLPGRPLDRAVAAPWNGQGLPPRGQDRERTPRLDAVQPETGRRVPPFPPLERVCQGWYASCRHVGFLFQ